MKKRISSALVWGGILLSISALCGCQELEEKNTKIETIKEQVKEIEASLPKLEQTDKELKAYIENLEATADDLRKSITASDDKIAELEKELGKAVVRANENAVAISKLRTDLETLSAEIAKCATDLNSRINDEIKALNETIDNLTVRVETLETEVKNLKTTISNIQTDIEELNGKVDALTNRIQSISFVPDYSDGRATMSYTLSGGMIVPGSVTMRFEIQPASLAEKIADVWKDVLSLKAVYTMTRASAGEMIELPISDVTSSDGIISVTASGSGIDEAYFRKDLSLNVRLLISDGNTQKASDYINMIPWTTDVMHIPDANFKSYLIKNFDADGDGKISGIEALLVTGIDVSSYKISTLSGIEYFVNLERLDCSSNLLTTLDVTHNTKLIELNISNNNIKNIDLSCCESLASLNCAGNGFVSLDVSRNKELKSLNCSGNTGLTTVDLSLLGVLTELDAHGCGLQSLDVTKNLALESLDCSGNSILSPLDVVNNTALKTLNCSNNNLTKINLTANTALKTLNLSYNNEISLVDLRNNTELTHLYVRHLNLSELDLTKVAQLQVLNVLENPVLARIVCPSQGWLTKADVSIGTQEVYCVTEAGLLVQGGCVKIDGKVWMGANVGYAYDNHYGGKYTFGQNPCPSGWRIPSKDELSSLSAHRSEMTTFNGVKGRWFSGSKTYSDSVPAIFLPILNGDSSYGNYWSSTAANGDSAYYLYVGGSSVYMNSTSRSNVYSVRCLKN